MKHLKSLTLFVTALTWAGTFGVNAQCTSGNCTDGYGTYSYNSGDKYTGYFAGGLRNGKGTYTWTNGNQYIGESLNDKFHGQGTYIFNTTGDKYIGSFASGLRNGYGTFYWKNGDIYEGNWSGDKMHGQGTRTYATGKVERGQWDMDVFKGSSGPDGSSFCIAMDRIRQAMYSDFASIKGTQHWDEENAMNYWNSTVTLPGTIYSDIEGASPGLKSSAYFSFIQTFTYADAESKFYELKRQMESCIPGGWFTETDASFDDERLEYVMMDPDYYDFYPGSYISLELVKQKKDGQYYVQVLFATTTD